MRKTTLLKKLINDPEILVMPGAYDVLSARIIEAAGFKAVQCFGFGFAASLLGLPDIGRYCMSVFNILFPPLFTCFNCIRSLK